MTISSTEYLLSVKYLATHDIGKYMMHIACYCTVRLQDLVIKSVSHCKGHIDQNEIFPLLFSYAL